jgi:large subunit ribosomal protein L31
VLAVGQKDRAMKKKGHPAYHVTKVHCGCGNEFVTRSTQRELRVDICSACHPFFTGTQKHVDAAGRIEKFRSKFAEGGYSSLQKPAKKKKAAAATDEE